MFKKEQTDKETAPVLAGFRRAFRCSCKICRGISCSFTADECNLLGQEKILIYLKVNT